MCSSRAPEHWPSQEEHFLPSQEGFRTSKHHHTERIQNIQHRNTSNSSSGAQRGRREAGGGSAWRGASHTALAAGVVKRGVGRGRALVCLCQALPWDFLYLMVKPSEVAPVSWAVCVSRPWTAHTAKLTKASSGPLPTPRAPSVTTKHPHRRQAGTSGLQAGSEPGSNLASPGTHLCKEGDWVLGAASGGHREGHPSSQQRPELAAWGQLLSQARPRAPRVTLTSPAPRPPCCSPAGCPVVANDAVCQASVTLDTHCRFHNVFIHKHR